MSNTRDQVRDLYAEGYSVRHISRVLDISTQMVYRHLRTAGVVLRERAS